MPDGLDLSEEAKAAVAQGLVSDGSPQGGSPGAVRVLPPQPRKMLPPVKDRTSNLVEIVVAVAVVASKVQMQYHHHHH